MYFPTNKSREIKKIIVIMQNLKKENFFFINLFNINILLFICLE
jgi:hypothetical protein